MSQILNAELVANLKPFIAKIAQQQIDSIPTTSDAETNPSTILKGDANGRIRVDALGIGVAPSGVGLSINGTITFSGGEAINSVGAISITPNTNLTLNPLSGLYLRPSGNTVYIDNKLRFDAAGTIDTASGNLTASPSSDLVLTPGSGYVKVSDKISVTNGIYAGASDGFAKTGQIQLNTGTDDHPWIKLYNDDVSHNLGGLTNSPLVGQIQKSSFTSGGLAIFGYAEGITSLNLKASSTTEATATSDSTYGAFQITATKDDGAHGSTGNVVYVSTGGTGLLIVKGNGDLHLNGVLGTAFDKENDIEIIRAAGLQFKGAIPTAFDNMIQYSKADLKRLNLMTGTWMNISNFIRLLVGNAWQQEVRMRKMEEVVHGSSFD